MSSVNRDAAFPSSASSSVEGDEEGGSSARERASLLLISMSLPRVL